MGVVGPGEVCLTSSTRNFRGRMGSPEAKVYMASSATVACIAGPMDGWMSASGGASSSREVSGTAPTSLYVLRRCGANEPPQILRLASLREASAQDDSHIFFVGKKRDKLNIPMSCNVSPRIARSANISPITLQNLKP